MTTQSYCKLCMSYNVEPLTFIPQKECPTFLRCADCGSDSSRLTYDQVRELYCPQYTKSQLEMSGGIDGQLKELTTNFEWFDRFEFLCSERTFLDVGCCEGGALMGMQERGWGVHGFDVYEPSYMGPHVTVAPYFHHRLFPRRYGAILAREVFEHVPCPQIFLYELHEACLKGGIVQIQTPHPMQEYNPNPYQIAHLHIASESKLQSMISSAGLVIIDSKIWNTGQAYLCQAG